MEKKMLGEGLKRWRDSGDILSICTSELYLDPYLNQLKKPFFRQTIKIKHRLKYWVTINFVRCGMLQIFVLKHSKKKKVEE